MHSNSKSLKDHTFKLNKHLYDQNSKYSGSNQKQLYKQNKKAFSSKDSYLDSVNKLTQQNLHNLNQSNNYDNKSGSININIDLQLNNININLIENKVESKPIINNVNPINKTFELDLYNKEVNFSDDKGDKASKLELEIKDSKESKEHRELRDSMEKKLSKEVRNAIENRSLKDNKSIRSQNRSYKEIRSVKPGDESESIYY